MNSLSASIRFRKHRRLALKILNAKWIYLAPFLVASYFVPAAIFALVYSHFFCGQIKESTGNSLEVFGSSLETFRNYFYFSLATQSTVGYGDIAAHDNARWLTGIHAFVGILISSTLVGILVYRIIRRECFIIFPKFICYDPTKHTFVLRAFNADADDLVSSKFDLSLARWQSKDVDPFISRKGYSLILDVSDDLYFPSGLTYAIRTVPSKLPEETSLDAKKTILSPTNLEAKDRLTITFNGQALSGGNPIYARQEYNLEDIRCGCYVNMEVSRQLSKLNRKGIYSKYNLKEFDNVKPTSEEFCSGCTLFTKGCKLAIAEELWQRMRLGEVKTTVEKSTEDF